MKKLLRNLLIKWLTRDFTISPKDKQMSEGEANGALIEFARNEPLQKYLNISLSNLIRRHLYIKDMYEKNYYSGQVVAIRTLQQKAKQALQESNEETLVKKLNENLTKE
jgi:hypothetical protein